MSLVDFLARTAPALHIDHVQGMLVRAHVAPEEFALVADELVNCRTLAHATQDVPAPRALEAQGLSCVHLFGTDDRAVQGTFGVHLVVRDDASQELLWISTELSPDAPVFHALTPEITAVNFAERALHDLLGIIPKGHPDLRRSVLHESFPEGWFPLRHDVPGDIAPPPASTPLVFPSVLGEGIVELPIGPVIGTGLDGAHVRVSVAGERTIAAEPRMAFSHKGVEKMVEGRVPDAALPLLERAAGDAVVAHALAFSRAVEAIAEIEVSDRAARVRAMMLEWERLAGHIAQMGTLAGWGTGQMVVGTRCLAVRERCARLAQEMSGSRWWRGMIVPGGVAKEFTADLAHMLQALNHVECAALRLKDMMLLSDGIRDRLEGVGVLTADAARAYGAVGPLARASGIAYDVRREYPCTAFAAFTPAIALRGEGDAFARLLVLWDEVKESIRLIREMIAHPGEGPLRTPCAPQDGDGVGLVEGHRGEVAAMVMLHAGALRRCVVRDPSWFHWQLISEIAPGNPVADMPIILASCSISPSGCDA